VRGRSRLGTSLPALGRRREGSRVRGGARENGACGWGNSQLPKEAGNNNMFLLTLIQKCLQVFILLIIDGNKITMGL